MPLGIIRGDITRIECDAIVNPTDERLSGGGGTDLAVHTAAGAGLDAECRKIGTLAVGKTAVTGAYGLPCRYVFHTVGPTWRGGGENEETLLRACYLGALEEAERRGLASLAFPLISSGTFGFPKDRVLRIATDAISEFLLACDGEMQVYICLFSSGAYTLSGERELSEYLGAEGERGYAAPSAADVFRADNALPLSAAKAKPGRSAAKPAPADICCEAAPAPEVMAEAVQGRRETGDLAQWIKNQDDSFAVMLLKLIDRKGMTDVQCYKKANVSKGTFWKINNDGKYKPSKATVLAFAIALELDLDETEQLLRTVGFSLSNSNTFDRIIQFYIINRNYDIFEINSALFRYDQVCLGC